MVVEWIGVCNGTDGTVKASDVFFCVSEFVDGGFSTSFLEMSPVPKSHSMATGLCELVLVL